MRTPSAFTSSRRRFLIQASALGAAALAGLPRQASAESPPEVKKIHLMNTPAICLAPQFLAEELLRLEGFSAVEYVNLPSAATLLGSLAAGRADILMADAPSLMPPLDAGQSIVVLSGVHAGCWELLGNERVRTIRDLKGKTVAISQIDAGDHVLISSMAAYIGMDPRKDINWVATQSYAASMQLFVDGKVDAFMAFPPQPQELRERQIGQVIINTTRDKPWSQYFCCMVAANADFAHNHPVATKRALRAILKAADVCAQDPERAARYMVQKGYESRYEIALDIVRELPYRRWREANPEDTLRFYALRLHEVGMIKSNPDKLIARGTDWRFLNELKKELKA